jgi:hypothetical protein
MGFVLIRGAHRLRCDAREGARCCELVITGTGVSGRVEQYRDRASLLRRQHELVRAWKAQGWLELEPEDAHISDARR